jgi:hypothetical protein
MLVILALGKARQEYLEFEFQASMGYLVGSRPVWAI